jgi:hypothetical protein
MRPRFTIRVLFLAIAIMALASYWAFVRPTVIAQQFVHAVKIGDYAKAQSFCGIPCNTFLSDHIAKMDNVEVKVRTHPRTWRDVWSLRQNMLLQIIPNRPRPESGLFVGYQADIVATSSRIHPSEMYVVTFER